MTRLNVIVRQQSKQQQTSFACPYKLYSGKAYKSNSERRKTTITITTKITWKSAKTFLKFNKFFVNAK